MNVLVEQQPAFAYTGGRPFDASRPSVVFVHGAANDHSVWTWQARSVAHHGWNALAVDLPGHGRSFGAARTRIEDSADWLIHLLDNAGLARAALVGHSMGSLIALDAAARHPARVTHLMLIGCSVPMPVSDALLEAARERPAEAFDMLNLWGHAPALKWGRNPSPGNASLMAYRRLLEKSATGALATDLAACHAYSPDASRLAAVTAPTRVLAGTRDLMTPARAGASLAARLPSAQFETCGEAGHSLMQERPAFVTMRLMALLPS